MPVEPHLLRPRRPWRARLAGRLALPGLSLVLMAGGAVMGSAQAANAVTSSWTTYDNFGAGVALNPGGVACYTPSNCVVTGAYSDGSGQVYTTNNGGTSWGSGTNFANDFPLTSASCGGQTCVGVGGYDLVSSADGGNSWPNDQAANIDGPLNAIACPTNNECLGVGTAGLGTSQYVVDANTTNGGANWSSSSGSFDPSYKSLTGVACLPGAANKCIGVGSDGTSGIVVTTTDSGADWNDVPDSNLPVIPNPPGPPPNPPYTCPPDCLLGSASLSAVTCPSTTLCLAVGQGVIVQSVDGGNTWTNVTPDLLSSGPPNGLSGAELYGISCSSSTACVTVGQGTGTTGAAGVALVTSDGGQTWTLDTTPLAPNPSILYSVSCDTGNNCMAVGEANTGNQAIVIDSTDGGVTWGSEIIPSGVGTLFGVSCPANSTDCVAVGQSGAASSESAGSGVIIRTLNGFTSGPTWTLDPVPSGTMPLTAVSCPAGINCYVAGQNAQFGSLVLNNSAVKTTGTWTASYNAPTPVAYLQSVSCASSTVCVAVAVGFGEGVIFSTASGGSSWNVVSPPNDINNIASVSCPTTTDCVAVAASLALQSTDGGNTWTQDAPFPGGIADITSVSCVPGTQTCIALGGGTTPDEVLSTDGGATWSPVNNPAVGTGIVGVSCATSGICVAVGNSQTTGAVAIVSTDTGTTWSTDPLPSVVASLSSVDCLPTTGGQTFCAVVGSDPSKNGVTATTNITPPPPVPPEGYDLLSADGAVYTFGNASNESNLPNLGIHVNNIVGMAVTKSQHGYWLVGSDGGVFGFGDSSYIGSLPALGVKVNNVVGIVPTATGKGYWMVGNDGGVFAFGDASYIGSLPLIHVHVNNIVGIVPTADNQGYWMVGSDGGVFAFGDAGYLGSLPLIHVHVNNVVGIVPTATGKGYWMVGNDGGVFAFGDAGYVGSLPGDNVHVHNVVAIAATPDNQGYWMVGTDGGLFTFGDAGYFGSLPGNKIVKNNVVSIVEA